MTGTRGIQSFWEEHFQTPSWVLDGAALDELELVLGGLIGAVRAYVQPGSERGDSAPVLEVPAGVGREAARTGSLLLTDPDGTPLAKLAEISVTPGPSENVYLSGSLTPLQRAEHAPARRFRLTAPLPNRPVVLAVNSMPDVKILEPAVNRARELGAELAVVAVVDSEWTHREIQTLLLAWQRSLDNVPRVALRLLVLPQPKSEPAGSTGGDVLRVLGAVELLDRREGNSSAVQKSMLRHAGWVVLFSGLSGSGKSTIARALVERLETTDSRVATLLDGDDVRRLLSSELGFSRVDRNLNVRRIGWVGSLLARTGGIAVCAPIAPYDAIRKEIRDMVEKESGFLLVHVSTPLEACEARDRKGLYAKARAGLIAEFTGISDPYEEPADAELTLDTAVLGIDECVDAVIGRLQSP